MSEPKKKKEKDLASVKKEAASPPDPQKPTLSWRRKSSRVSSSIQPQLPKAGTPYRRNTSVLGAKPKRDGSVTPVATPGHPDRTRAPVLTVPPQPGAHRVRPLMTAPSLSAEHVKQGPRGDGYDASQSFLLPPGVPFTMNAHGKVSPYVSPPPVPPTSFNVPPFGYTPRGQNVAQPMVPANHTFVYGNVGPTNPAQVYRHPQESVTGLLSLHDIHRPQHLARDDLSYGASRQSSPANLAPSRGGSRAGTPASMHRLLPEDHAGQSSFNGDGHRQHLPRYDPEQGGFRQSSRANRIPVRDGGEAEIPAALHLPKSEDLLRFAQLNANHPLVGLGSAMLQNQSQHGPKHGGSAASSRASTPQAALGSNRKRKVSKETLAVLPREPKRSHLVPSTPPGFVRAQERPGYGNVLFFQSRDEALHGVTVPDWSAPDDDPTLPTTQEERQEWVRELVRAFLDISQVQDKQGPTFKNRWYDQGHPELGYKNYYDRKAIEKICWDIVDMTENLHRIGLKAFSCYDPAFQKLVAKTQELTFEDRMQKMIYLFSRYKARCDKIFKGSVLETYIADPDTMLHTAESNRDANDKRQGYITHGRDSARDEDGGVVRSRRSKRNATGTYLPSKWKSQLLILD
jgi:hypothetical protein